MEGEAQVWVPSPAASFMLAPLVCGILGEMPEEEEMSVLVIVVEVCS